MENSPSLDLIIKVVFVNVFNFMHTIIVSLMFKGADHVIFAMVVTFILLSLLVGRLRDQIFRGSTYSLSIRILFF